MAFTIRAVAKVIPKSTDEDPQDSIILKLASCILGPGEQVKEMIEGEALLLDGNQYATDMEVPEGFGDIGAVIVEVKENTREEFIHSVIVKNLNNNAILATFSCNSWVQPTNLIPNQPRVFFSIKSYLPQNTPAGLLSLRKEDLKNVRGEQANGTDDMGARESHERIYNYDVYNDLGDPDEDNVRLRRPVLGSSSTHPYPRRCRTGRPHCVSDPASEQRSVGSFYVPRDEDFSEVKKAMLPTVPGRNDNLGASPFVSFPQIDQMFNEGIQMPPEDVRGILTFVISDLLTPDQPDADDDDDDDEPGLNNDHIAFPPPEALNKDKFNWLSDREFARQTLAGVNPYAIQLLRSTMLPLRSELDAEQYGPQESAFTNQHIQDLIRNIGSNLTVEEAVEQKKLFIIDYHDALVPFVEKVRGLEGTTLYGSRTLFFLHPHDILMPLAIELTRPKINAIPQWKQVFKPTHDSTDSWLWRLAKAHVLAHDSCAHQLDVHWLRTHSCVEPYAIATNRQLSTMHPIYRLLHPHFRYNLRINSNAREILINAGGIVESTFSAGAYSMEFSSLMYKKWRFDTQSLPDDLVNRGMAERDVEQPHNLNLAIKDYPFANDGLLLWDALVEWMTAYVNHYYPNDGAIKNDTELKAWWKDIKKKGHEDKKNATWWPDLKTPNDLIGIVSSMAWLGCGQHSAVNFIQYAYAAYFPSRPTIVRTNMPTEGPDLNLRNFIRNPETAMLQAFPSVAQASTVAKTMLLLSTHSPDEEYLGSEIEPAWKQSIVITRAFEQFKSKLEELERTIDAKNQNKDLKNRCGAGIVPYEVFKATSNPGVTGKGLPYSVST